MSRESLRRPVVAITGVRDPGLIDSSIATGVGAYLTKPIDDIQLDAAIRLAAARHARSLRWKAIGVAAPACDERCRGARAYRRCRSQALSGTVAGGPGASEVPASSVPRANVAMNASTTVGSNCVAAHRRSSVIAAACGMAAR